MRAARANNVRRVCEDRVFFQLMANRAPIEKLRKLSTVFVGFQFQSKSRMSLSVCAFSRCGSLTTITAAGEKKVLAFGDDQNLFEVLTSGGIMKASGTCMGNMACGKCQVKLVSGNVAAIEDEEKEMLGDAPPEVRLACAITLTSEADGAVFEVI